MPIVQNYLKKLVSFKTITGNHAETEKSFEWIKSILKGLPLYFREYSSNGFPSLVISTRKTKKPDIILYAHIDVVPADDFLFLAQLKGNRMYGRGTYDMKSGLACYIKLFKDLGKNLKKYSLAMMVTSDEEVGGEDGARYLLENIGYKSKVAFLPDSISPDGPWQVETIAKGVMFLKLSSYGKHSHGSRPWEGNNALSDAIDFLTNLSFLNKKYNNKKFSSTASVNVFHSGEFPNQVPNHAKVIIDIRFSSVKDKQKILRTIRQGLEEYRNIKMEVTTERNLHKTSLNNKYVKKYEIAINDVYKKRVEELHSHGSSDATFFSKHKIATIVASPAGGCRHSNKEFVYVGDLDKFVSVLRRYIENF
jgi:succinyl-diaminopimelate desuccinylase